MLERRGAFGAALRGATVRGSEADSRVDLAALSLDGTCIRDDRVIVLNDGCAFSKDVVDSSEIHVEGMPYGRPTILVCCPLALLHEVVEYLGTILLDALNVLEEAFTLPLQDCSSEFGSGLRGDDRRVQGVEHGNAVVLIKGFERQLIDEDLGGFELALAHQRVCSKYYVLTHRRRPTKSCV